MENMHVFFGGLTEHANIARKKKKSSISVEMFLLVPPK